MTATQPRDDSPRSSSRRDFLKSASAAGAGAILVPAGLSWSAPERLVPKGANERIGIGLIGCGGMGNAHLNSLCQLGRSGKENITIVALADVCKPRLESSLGGVRKKGSPEAQAYRDYHELLARKDVDVVWIASPEHWHSQMTIDAVAAGKDVYVEKPMTLRLAGAVALWKAVKKSDRVVQVGTQYVMNPKYHKARELIEAGKIGKPLSSVTGYCRNTPDGEWNYYRIDPQVVPGEMLDWKRWCGPLGEAPFDTKIYHRWRRYRRYSTGIIGDLLVHQMTPLAWALNVGWPKRVVGIGGHYIDKAMENHDQVNLTIQFEKEHTMVVWGATNNAQTPAPAIRGNKGNLELSGNNCRLTPERPYAEDIDAQNFKLPGSTHDDLRQDFLAAARERRQPSSPVDLGLRIMVIVDLATRAMWEGRSFEFDPETFEVTGL